MSDKKSLPAGQALTVAHLNRASREVVNRIDEPRLLPSLMKRNRIASSA